VGKRKRWLRTMASGVITKVKDETGCEHCREWKTNAEYRSKQVCVTLSLVLPVTRPWTNRITTEMTLLLAVRRASYSTMT